MRGYTPMFRLSFLQKKNNSFWTSCLSLTDENKESTLQKTICSWRAYSFLKEIILVPVFEGRPNESNRLLSLSRKVLPYVLVLAFRSIRQYPKTSNTLNQHSCAWNACVYLYHYQSISFGVICRLSNR